MAHLDLKLTRSTWKARFGQATDVAQSPTRAWLLALIFVLALPPLWLSLVAAPSLRIDVGQDSDTAYLSGVHAPERNATENFRWTKDRADLVLPNLSGRYQVLRVYAHGWRPPGIDPPLVRVEAGGRRWASFQTVRELHAYDILLPRDDTGTATRVAFLSAAAPLPGDRRDVGFAIDWIELRATGEAAGPAPAQLGGQALLLGLALLLVGKLALPRGWAVAVALALTAALLAANLAEPLWVSQALAAWLPVAGALLAATWLAAPRLGPLLAPWMTARQAGVAWALLMAALALRLLGATHPLFEIHDLGFHRIWSEAVTRGELYIYSAPSEFQNRTIFNPPAGYVLLAPFQLLLPSYRLPLQVGIGLFDALGCLLLLPLARELGLPARAALLALALYLALPINATMLWWGFATNTLAQTSGLLLVWALLRFTCRPARSGWLLFTIACAVSVLMHIGALVLTLALLGATLALGWPRLAPALRRAVIGGVLLVLALTGLFYFAAVVDPAVARPAYTDVPAAQGGIAAAWADWPTRLGLASRAVALAFLPAGALLAPLGFLQLLRRRAGHPLGRALILAWLAVCAGFFSMYLGLGLFVRYVYFAPPLVALALGVLLNGLWPRGRLVALALLLLVAWSGVALWAFGVLLQVKPSLLPLTH
jgi:toxin CptA